VERLRAVRRTPPCHHIVTISAADPLNLAGIVTSGERIRALVRTRIVYRDGVPIAVRDGDHTRELIPLDAALAHAVAVALRATGSRRPLTISH
jgi:ATP-dependent helicase Lhr and Lhr-like helicase